MVELTFREPSFSPRTVEEAQFLEDHRKMREAQKRGEWLPEGWAWVEDDHPRIPSDGFGAWDEQHNILVYVAPPVWACPYCGADRLTGGPCAGDYMDAGARGEALDTWRHERATRTVLRVHGYGAGKVIFDMVWNRFVQRLLSSDQH
jgi:hypothetical protein